jgi:hypothetical protein
MKDANYFVTDTHCNGRRILIITPFFLYWLMKTSLCYLNYSPNNRRSKTSFPWPAIDKGTVWPD